MHVRTLAFAVAIALLTQAADAASVLPTPADAAVVIANQSPCGSGIIIARDNENSFGISAAHCFEGHIGRTFRIYAATGIGFEATLIHHDKKRDLALFKTHKDATVAVAPVARLANLKPDQRANVVSFPQTNGPKLDDDVVVTGAAQINGRKLNQLRTSIPIEPGSSGGGLTIDGYTVGVITRSNHADSDGRTAYAVTNADLCEFLNQCPGPGCYKTQPNVDLAKREDVFTRSTSDASTLDRLLQNLTEPKRQNEWRPGCDPRLVRDDQKYNHTMLVIVLIAAAAFVVISKQRDR